jgi:hypothetical protein
LLNKNKIDKKSGRKQPRANDYEATVVEPAPDADFGVNENMKLWKDTGMFLLGTVSHNTYHLCLEQ